MSGIRRAKELEEWINAMPIDWQALAELKKYLQVEIEQYGCQQAMQLTARFLRFHFPEDQKEFFGLADGAGNIL